VRLYRTKSANIIESESQFYASPIDDWNTLINRKNLHQFLQSQIRQLQADSSLKKLIDTSLLAPIVQQEVWAAGVTYLRSREARMEESKDAGGGDFYARVYEADRPEIFFKATAFRTVGHQQPVRIRKDSKWNVPEPELTLFVCSDGSIEGYTVGNDMSSRDIEGENPLYLPQAKSYDGSAALGPCLYIPSSEIKPETKIVIDIQRNRSSVFSSEILINRMKRKHTELVSYLLRETSFPYGVFLMTGTGIVPPDHFTLNVGDVVNISIDGVGTLSNTVTQ
jgi:2-dehydro-3-deoxy-D-arabinonate dehydratase